MKLPTFFDKINWQKEKIKMPEISKKAMLAIIIPLCLGAAALTGYLICAHFGIM